MEETYRARRDRAREEKVPMWKLLPANAPLTVRFWLYVQSRKNGCYEDLAHTAEKLGVKYKDLWKVRDRYVNVSHEMRFEKITDKYGVERDSLFCATPDAAFIDIPTKKHKEPTTANQVSPSNTSVALAPRSENTVQSELTTQDGSDVVRSETVPRAALAPRNAVVLPTAKEAIRTAIECVLGDHLASRVGSLALEVGAPDLLRMLVTKWCKSAKAIELANYTIANPVACEFMYRQVHWNADQVFQHEYQTHMKVPAAILYGLVDEFDFMGGSTLQEAIDAAIKLSALAQEVAKVEAARVAKQAEQEDREAETRKLRGPDPIARWKAMTQAALAT